MTRRWTGSAGIAGGGEARFLRALPLAALLCTTSLAPWPAWSQEAGEAGDAAEATEAAEAGEDLLTAEELQTLVAPVALYPDTLLIQILVGATAPLDVVKADRLIARNDGADPDAFEAEVKAEAFDPSVEVLTLAFPEVVGEMATHIEWTETVGTAMLAQSDDMLDAVQVMRDTAIDTGALVDNEEQVVTRDETTDAVIIQPADPQVVYVPRYDPQVVYDTSLSDALIAGAVTFGTVALISEIFDDDDDWGGSYWGCRNCGGWGGGPIIRDPDIDIDIDGNVNIGNRLNIDRGDRLNIDRDNINIDRDNLNIDRDNIGNNVGWRPDPDRSGEARDKIAARRGEGGATTLPIKRPASDADALRDRLSRETGARDITRERDPGRIRDSVAANRPAVNRPSGDRPSVSRPSGERPAVNRPSGDRPAVNRPQVDRPSGDGAADARAKLRERSASHAALKRPAQVRKPNVSRPAAANAAKRAPQIQRKSSGNRAKAASHRGGGAKARMKRR
jgi:hypothetical protein